MTPRPSRQPADLAAALLALAAFGLSFATWFEYRPKDRLAQKCGITTHLSPLDLFCHTPIRTDAWQAAYPATGVALTMLAGLLALFVVGARYWTMATALLGVVFLLLGVDVPRTFIPARTHLTPYGFGLVIAATHRWPYYLALAFALGVLAATAHGFVRAGGRLRLPDPRLPRGNVKSA